MSEMVERVARALIETHARSKLMPEQAIQSIVEREWRHHVPWARATIAAMREPTGGMVNTAHVMLDREGYLGSEDIENAYRAMIDAALAEETKP